MHRKSAKKDATPQKQREGSRVGRFVIGALVGILIGWLGGQFVRFDTGWNLMIYLGSFGALFGVLGAILPKETFLKLLDWFR